MALTATARRRRPCGCGLHCLHLVPSLQAVQPLAAEAAEIIEQHQQLLELEAQQAAADLLELQVAADLPGSELTPEVETALGEVRRVSVCGACVRANAKPVAADLMVEAGASPHGRHASPQDFSAAANGAGVLLAS